jgi:acyl carrier protein
MEEKILEILEGLHPEFNYATSANFLEDGLLDSFDVVALVTELEQQFDISVDGEDILPENFQSVDSIEQLVNKSVVHEL